MVFMIPAAIAAAEAAAAAGTALAVGEGAAVAGGALAAGEAAAGAGAAATAVEAGTAGSLLAAGGTTASTTASAGGVLGDAAAGLGAAGGAATGAAPSALAGLIPSAQQAAMGASLLGGAASANQQMVAGRQAAAAGKYNAKVSENNAIGAVQAGTANEALLHARNTKQLATASNALGATGIQTSSGSPLDVMADMAGGMALDEAMTRWNAGTQAAGFGAQAKLDRYQAGQAGRAGAIGAAGTLLNTAGRTWGPAPTRAGV
jgi:hypothetical protein